MHFELHFVFLAPKKSVGGTIPGTKKVVVAELCFKGICVMLWLYKESYLRFMQLAYLKRRAAGKYIAKKIKISCKTRDYYATPHRAHICSNIARSLQLINGAFRDFSA